VRLQLRLFSALAVAVIAAGASSPANAISIAVTSSSNATTSSTSGPSADRAGAQSLTITDAGGTVANVVSATVDAASRYVSNAAADRPIAFSGGTASWTYNSNYTVNLSITLPPAFIAATYNVIVDTSILGELTLLDDTAASSATATVSNVTGKLGATTLAGLGISGIAQSFSTGTGLNAAEERNISGSNSINLGTFTGNQSFSLNFTFSTSASSPQSVGGGDEAAARFGASGPLSGTTADDYPGPGDVVDRTQANDGHFVTVKATLLTVPEPGTLLLLGAGFAGLAAAGTRQRS
jgi:hypothetical protein